MERVGWLRRTAEKGRGGTGQSRGGRPDRKQECRGPRAAGSGGGSRAGEAVGAAGGRELRWSRGTRDGRGEPSAEGRRPRGRRSQVSGLVLRPRPPLLWRKLG